METAHSASTSPSVHMEWLRWVGWTWGSVIASLAIARGFAFGGSYTMSGGQGDCLGLGSPLSELLVGLAQLLAVVMFDRKGPGAFWAGIITTAFVRYVPSAAVLGWVVVTTPIEVDSLKGSAVFWWTASAVLATAALIWLCSKRGSPGWMRMAVSGLASAFLLVFLSQWTNDFYVNPILPWRSMLLWQIIAQ